MHINARKNLNLDFLDILHAKRGVVCAIGAGGKKTTLYTLAGFHPGRVGITTTVQLPPFPQRLPGARVIAPAADLVEQVALAASRYRVVAFAHPSEKYRRVAGVSPELLAEIQARVNFDLLLVKADGARQKSIKAPAPYEPVIPFNVDTVLVLISAGVLGKPLDDDLAHRVELIETVSGARRGELLQPEHLARLLISPQGALQGVSGTRIIPVINQVDDNIRMQLATEVAKLALMQTGRFDQVVLASMRRAEIVDIIRR